jgi:hypothetical protein
LCSRTVTPADRSARQERSFPVNTVRCFFKVALRAFTFLFFFPRWVKEEKKKKSIYFK